MGEDWRSKALCRHIPTGVFFPPSTASQRVQYPAEHYSPRAVAACRACAVSEQCLDEALRSNLAGIWAGTMPHERMRLARERGITMRPVMAPDHAANAAEERVRRPARRREISR